MNPLGCLRGVEISPEIASLKLAELRFWGPPESIKNKFEKLASWGISEELVGEKNREMVFFGVRSKTGWAEPRKTAFF